MALESFYGGKQGVSPVIRAKFDTRKELGDAFSDPSYKDVWFSELAIIDSPNKLHKDNGKLYRRTLSIVTLNEGDPDYAGPHAEYIGQIVGPAGGIPNITLTTLEDLQSKATGTGIETGDQVSFPIKSGDNTWAQSNEIISDPEPGSSESRKEFFIAEKSATELNQIPGKTDDDTYNDSIRYSWFQVLKPASEDSEDNQISYVYLGFEIPYPVFNFSVNISNYDKNPTITDISEIKDDGSKKHPYYWDYNITIPRGIRGIWQEVNLGTINEFYNLNNNTWKKIIYHSINDLEYKENTDSYNIKNGAATAEEDFKVNNNFKDGTTQFWYLTVKCPKLTTQEESNDYNVTIDEFYFYLEDFRVLDDVTFNNDNGDITLIYNNNDSIDLKGIYSYVSKLYFTPGDKALAVEYTGAAPDLNANTDLFAETQFPETPDEITRYFIQNPDITDGISKIYWNLIQDIYTDYQKNAFYILFSSNYLEPTLNGSEEQGDTKIFNGKTWTYKASPLNNASRWWYTISPITETRQGIRILTTLDLTKYKYQNLLVKTTEDEDIVIDVDGVINALNSSDIDWNPLKEGEASKNPYKDGQNGSGGNMNGQFGIYNGYAFYYDTIKNTWATIGSWNDSTAAEHQAYIELDGTEDGAKSANYSIGLTLNTLSLQDGIAWPNLDI